jgi:hypothetical protein
LYQIITGVGRGRSSSDEFGFSDSATESSESLDSLGSSSEDAEPMVFYFADTPMTWQDHENFAMSCEGHLASITSQSENDLALEVLQESSS